jgi:hypothetical protein
MSSTHGSSTQQIQSYDIMAPKPISPQRQVDLITTIEQLKLQARDYRKKISAIHNVKYSSRKERSEAINAVYAQRDALVNEIKTLEQKSREETRPIDVNVLKDVQQVCQIIDSLNEWITHASFLLGQYVVSDDATKGPEQMDLEAGIAIFRANLASWQQEHERLTRSPMM